MKHKIFITLFVLIFVFSFGCTSKKKEDPENKEIIKAFTSFTNALNQKNWQVVWDSLSEKSQNAFSKEGYKRMQEIVEAMPPEIRKKKIDSLGITNNDFLSMTPDKFFIFVMEQTQDSQEFSSIPLSGEVSSVLITPVIPKNESPNNEEPSNNITARAVLKLKDNMEEAVMVKQNGIWKIEFED